jgi:ribosomal protein S18 acetylase RimI-like enzyme
MEALQYRRATAPDIPALARIRREGGWDGGAPEERMALYLAGEHHPQHALLPRIMFLALADSVPVGYIAGHLTRRYECDGELEWMFVSPAHRRAGVAGALLRLLATWFAEQGAARVCVDVEPSNTAARHFYRSRGAVDLNPHWLVWNDIRDLAV